MPAIWRPVLPMQVRLIYQDARASNTCSGSSGGFMKARFVGVLIAVSLFFGAANVAHADDDADRRQQRSKALWDEGSRRYDLGKFDEAVDLFLKAYEIWPFEPILFNLCQAHRQKSDYKKAVFYCKAYLRNLPGAKNRQDVEDLVIDMEKTLEQQKATNDRPPEGVEHPIPRGIGDPGGGSGEGGGGSDAHPYRTWKWLTLISGGLGVAAGVTLIVIDEDEYSAAGVRNDNYRDTALPGVISTAVGTALVGTGVVLWIMDDKSGGPHRAAGDRTVGIVPTVGGFIVGFSGSF